MHTSPHLKKYVIGFGCSIVLTLVAYGVVAFHMLPAMALGIILALALIQLFVQLFFFLHLGQESKPHWNLMAFLLTVPVIAIVVLGSLWIMHHLNYNMMPEDVNSYIQAKEAIHL